MGDRPDMVISTEDWQEHDMTPITREEVMPLFDPNAIAGWRKDNAQRFKPVPKPSRMQRLLNWFRRTLQ